MLQLSHNELDKLIMIGDRILIRPTKPAQKTDSGIYLPQGMHRKEEMRTGYIIKVGPGYPIPTLQDAEEQWKSNSNNTQFVPLQAQTGDLAVYIQNNVFEIQFNNQEYVIAPQSAILMVVREDE